MSLSSAVDWWEEWQLRILVLGSLFVQFFLHFSACMRPVPIRMLRVLVWIAYIGGDALAIYALATLFNRHKQRTLTADGASSNDLEVLWAPVLLIHLGSQHGITAYSLQDNELWMRHVITLVSQVTVALYVFCKWWSGDKRLLHAAVLLFIVGIIKFGLKPWALRRASFNSMLASSDVSLQRRKGRSSPSCWTSCTSYFLDPFYSDGRRGGGEERALSLEEYVQEAKRCVQGQVECESAGFEHYAAWHQYICQMFVDLSAPYLARLSALQYFLKVHDKGAHNMLKRYMRFTFRLLYTKSRTSYTRLGMCIWILLPFLALASVVLFAKTNKDGYNENDVRVAYILFCCTALLEFSSFFFGVLLPTVWLCSRCYREIVMNTDCISGWHDMVWQNNLMSFCARMKKPTIMMKLATFNCLREYLNKHWYIRQVPAAGQITGLVRQHVKDGWKKYIRGDSARYRRFDNLRGQRILGKHHQLGQLGWSLNVPFDESVLLWHIATDLCFHHPNTSPQPQGRLGEATNHCRQISNYMIYLLFIRPEMLMPGTRPSLFTIAGDDIQLMLKVLEEPASLDERSIARGILHMIQFPWLYTDRIGSVIPDAFRLAEALMKLGDEEKRWTVIQGVWMEMLCYSASRCRGYLHAKSLGEGGEYLTEVWLLWSFMGMETLADRHHSFVPQKEEEEEEEEEEAVDALTSRSQGGADQSTEISPV